VTQTYLSSEATTAPFIPREASAAGRLRSNALSVEVAALAVSLVGDQRTVSTELQQ
jgi:hypothetical protein